MDTRLNFVPLTELATELDLCCAAVRRWAGGAHVPLFRCVGERDALLRHRDAERLRAELAGEARFASPRGRGVGASSS